MAERRGGLDELRRELDGIDRRREPDRWALAAYRVGLAGSELATGAEAIHEALGLLTEAGRILDPERAPVEHGRILVAAGSCHRALGDPRTAIDRFDAARRLLDGRTALAEAAAVEGNLAVALTEAGRAADAVELLDVALARVDGDDEERRRVAASLRYNRGQARQALARPDTLRGAVADYRAVTAALTVADAPLQLAMAHHGAATALLALAGPDGVPEPEALAHVDAALGILTSSTFPLQHGIAQHTRAMVLRRSGRVLDLRRALVAAHASAMVFDPRLHAAQWRTAAAAREAILDELRGAGAPGALADHVVELMLAVDGTEATAVLRSFLGWIEPLPLDRRRGELDALVRAAADREPRAYERFLRVEVPVLMELPEAVLEPALGAHADAAARPHCRDEALDAAVDRVVHDLLFGPQRIRVRDLLTAHGWERP